VDRALGYGEPQPGQADRTIACRGENR